MSQTVFSWKVAWQVKGGISKGTREAQTKGFRTSLNGWGEGVISWEERAGKKSLQAPKGLPFEREGNG